jgi:hypothetical protein
LAISKSSCFEEKEEKRRKAKKAFNTDGTAKDKS